MIEQKQDTGEHFDIDTLVVKTHFNVVNDKIIILDPLNFLLEEIRRSSTATCKPLFRCFSSNRVRALLIGQAKQSASERLAAW